MMLKLSEVDHRLERAQVLRRLRAGKGVDEAYLNAQFLLVEAARFHGRLADGSCPVCGSDQLRVVEWVFGEVLGKRTGTARSREEIERIVAEGIEVTVHAVEVCPACKWNFLVSEAVYAKPH